jgi:hypothetical protein
MSFQVFMAVVFQMMNLHLGFYTLQQALFVPVFQRNQLPLFSA